jgi:hypothetical protein
MAKPIKEVPPPKGARAARTRAPRRPAPRDGGSKASHSGSGFRDSPWSISRAEGLTAPRIRQNIARMLESRQIDPPAGFVQLQIARLSEAMIVACTMTRRAMCAR